MYHFIRRSFFCMSKIKDTIKHNLDESGFPVRHEPHQKQRKYINVEITQQFKKQQQQRKLIRIDQMRARRNLLQQRQKEKTILLTQQQKLQLVDINKQLVVLQENFKDKLAEIDQKLQQTQAQYIVAEGTLKQIILNEITYLKHINSHPSGLILHPESIKQIENVHYMVNNNLPVNRYRLYEVMPDLFQAQIDELEQSIKRLIIEKSIDPQSSPSGLIRFFSRKSEKNAKHMDQDVIDLEDQRNRVFDNLQDKFDDEIAYHVDYMEKVAAGLTPFRSVKHMWMVFSSQELNINLNQEETAMRKTLLWIAQERTKYDIYSQEIEKKILETRFRYEQPPVFVANHPVLLERYNKVMEKFRNPTLTIEDHLGELQGQGQDDGRSYYIQRFDKLVSEKYQPMFEELWNSGKKDQLVARKKEIEMMFHNDSTQIYEDYQNLLAQNKSQEEFLKIPKRQREIVETKKTELTLDEITKTLFLNNKDPQKYSIKFFTKYFGFDNEEDVTKLFNSFSYLHVFEQEQTTVETIKFEIIKFKDP